MKNFCLRALLLTLLSFAFTTNHAQVNLPYTLNFSFNDAANWSDGIAQDGDGGSSNINGLDIQIYATDVSFNQLAGGTIEWYDNSFYLSGTPTYNGITTGPGGTGVDAIILKSSSTSVNFALKSMELYDWGGTSPLRVAAYDNGVFVGSTDVSFDQVGWTVANVSFNQTYFGNIDEVRFYASPSVGTSPIYLTMNAISLAAATSTLPVRFSYFNARTEPGNSVTLQWQTANEQNADHFEIEQSTDGIEFVKRGEVKAGGTRDSKSDYIFVYKGKDETENFFRIKEIDVDGRFIYSKVIEVTGNQPDQVQVFPNPAKGRVTIVSTENMKDVVLFNSWGMLLKRMKPNSKTVSFDVSQLPAGVYFLQTDLHKAVQQHLLFVK